jgi:hypothetical protein
VDEAIKLKALIVYDADKNEYSASAHNCDPQQVAQLVEKGQPDLCAGCRFIVLDQKRAHKTPDAQQCRACRDQVRKLSGLQPPPRFKRREL